MADKTSRVAPLKVSADIVRKCCGLSIDIGSSAAKIIYRTKADWEASKDTEKAKGTLQFLVCGREDLDNALQKVKEEIYLTNVVDGRTTVLSVGVGSYQYSDVLEGALPITLNNIFEVDCMMLGFHTMLGDIASDEACYPKYTAEEQEVIQIANIELEESNKFLQDNSTTKLEFSNDLPKCTAGIALDNERSVVEIVGKENVFPCMMAHLGSMNGNVQMNEDRTIKNLGGCSRGGRYLLGVASLLTGCKSYNDFIDLAEKGDSSKVDEHNSDLANRRRPQGPGRENDAYGKFLNKKSDVDPLAFNFGQAVFQDADKFSKEDVACAWLSSHLQELCSGMYSEASRAGYKFIFVGGNLCNREFVRKLMTKIHTKVKLDTARVGREVVSEPELVFLKQGGHTGALGAIVKNVAEEAK